ncbi:MAG: histidinol-phosphatase [Paramuribaculum sp.]|jgi:histidinol-phosphatase (PHP family)
MFDFKSIALGDSRYNFHSHTQFCDGRATMAEFAEAVSKAGFRHWGFSPHSPVPIDSPCNMAEYDVPIYLAEVCRLNSLYESSDIEFYASMEIDYLGEHWGPANDYFQQLPLDYRIGSVHFVPAPDTGEPVDIDGRYESFLRKMHDYFHDDIHYVVNTFFDQSLAMVRAGGFDLIGHFDKIGHNASHFCPGIEDEPFYRRRLLELTDAIIASGVTVEINTKALAEHGRLFPSPSVWPILLKAGVPVVVNSDAHYPHLVNASRPEALAMLEKTAAEISTPTL